MQATGPARLSVPGAGRVPRSLMPYRCWPPRQERVPSPALLADAGQLGPGGVEVALGALSPAAQLAA